MKGAGGKGRRPGEAQAAVLVGSGKGLEPAAVGLRSVALQWWTAEAAFLLHPEDRWKILIKDLS